MRNKYPGKCYRCFLWVGVGEGHFERIPGGWRLQHATCAIEHRKKKHDDKMQRLEEQARNVTDTRQATRLPEEGRQPHLHDP